MKTLYDNTIKPLERVLYNQDLQQLLRMSMSVTLELYRMMVSSLLILFIPQKCENHICSLTENLESPTQKYFIGLIINYITMGSLLIMYICEIRREEKLIKILEVNNTISTDNESVGKRLEVLDWEKRNKLFFIDRNYQYASYFAIFIYIINAVLSGIVIQDYSLGNQTIMVYLTNILFMLNKFSNVYIIINTDKNIFFSAYLNTKVQFNDIDPREIVKIEKRRSLRRNSSIKDRKFELLENGGFNIECSSSESDKDFMNEDNGLFR